MVRDAIGNLPFARNKDEFDNLLGQIETRINRKIAEGAQASKSVPNLDVTGGAALKLRKITASELTEAQAAINAGVDRNKVIQRLRQHRHQPGGALIHGYVRRPDLETAETDATERAPGSRPPAQTAAKAPGGGMFDDLIAETRGAAVATAEPDLGPYEMKPQEETGFLEGWTNWPGFLRSSQGLVPGAGGCRTGHISRIRKGDGSFARPLIGEVNVADDGSAVAYTPDGERVPSTATNVIFSMTRQGGRLRSPAPATPRKRRSHRLAVSSCGAWGQARSQASRPCGQRPCSLAGPAPRARQRSTHSQRGKGKPSRDARDAR